MALDAFTDEKPRPMPSAHELGQDLATLSVGELDERIALLLAEIERLREAKTRKEASRSAADAFFRV